MPRACQRHEYHAAQVGGFQLAGLLLEQPEGLHCALGADGDDQPTAFVQLIRQWQRQVIGRGRR